MNRRITITIDKNLESKLRTIQAAKITDTNKSVSFSQILNMILHEGLKNHS